MLTDDIVFLRLQFIPVTVEFGKKEYKILLKYIRDTIAFNERRESPYLDFLYTGYMDRASVLVGAGTNMFPRMSK